ncbi:hypothetical protein B0H19DRAFT_1185979 [Mycena capillaripes]|nr:hypothetical protein B0H19DRAFT_1185979 [Mycena capillaripes]
MITQSFPNNLNLPRKIQSPRTLPPPIQCIEIPCRIKTGHPTPVPFPSNMEQDLPVWTPMYPPLQVSSIFMSNATFVYLTTPIPSKKRSFVSRKKKEPLADS